MATKGTQLDRTFLANLAHGGFAESMTREQRRAIHVQTAFDDYLDAALEDNKQIVLTGNPGDGKTQYILMMQEKYPDAFYIKDASTYSDYTVLLDEWKEAYEEGKRGILAINDGPLHEMITSHREEYSFLPTVEEQLENQLSVSEDDFEGIDFDEIVVIDLNNRNFLARKVVHQAIQKLTSDEFDTGHDHVGDCHIEYNTQKLQNDDIQENFKRLLKTVGKLDEHVTIRDLLNFLAYCLTGGKSEGVIDYGEDLKYYNLAFTGNGKIFTLLREYFHPRDLTHPFIDSQLWARAEQTVSQEGEYDFDKIDQKYLHQKRRFYFEDFSMDIGYSSDRDLYHEINYDFLDLRNREEARGRGNIEDIIERINRYFMPDSFQRDSLFLWFSHTYHSKSTKVLICRNEVSNTDLTRKKPKLHPEIDDAIGEDFVPNHYALEYVDQDDPVQLRIDRQLHESLTALDASIPYILRDREEERRLLEFMEKISLRESVSETSDDVRIKDTETGDMKSIEVADEVYDLGGR
jgi:hypothetical protein